MKILTLEMNNFMPFEYELIDFTAYKGIIGIYGENGAGKSSIFEAIHWVITGQTIRKKMTADAIVNEKHDKDTFVKIVIEHQGKKYVITRYRKHSVHNNILFFGDDKDETCLTMGTNTDTQAKIYDVLNINENVLQRSLFFTGKDIEPFVEMTDNEIKELLEKVLGFDIMDKYVKAVNNLKKEYEPKIRQLQDDLLQAKTIFDERTKVFHDSHRELDRIMKESKAKIEKMQGESKIDIEPYKTKKQNILYNLDKIHQTESEYPQIKNEFETAKSNLNKATNIYNKLVLKNDSIESEIKELKNYQFPEFCENCGRKYTVRSLQASKRNLKQRIKALEEEHADVLKNLKFAKEQKDKAQEAFDYYQNQINLYDKILMQKPYLKREMEQVKQQIEDAIKYNQSLDEQEDYYRQIIYHKKQERIKCRQAMVDAEKQYKEIKKQYDSLSEEYQVINELKYVLGNYGVKDIYLDKILPFLNELIIDYISKLGNIDISFNKKSTKKGNKFDIIINNKDGSKNYFANSTGEKAKIDIASSLAFQSFLQQYLQMDTNVIFLDEPFESLSQKSSESVIKLLTTISKNTTLFIISHNENSKYIVDDAIYIKSDNRISKIIK